VPTPGPLATRPPAPVEDEGLDALLALFVTAEAAAPSTHPSLRSSAASLLVWVRGSSRRAAAWGAAPAQAGGAW
jgi:hypothetical protein